VPNAVWKDILSLVSFFFPSLRARVHFGPLVPGGQPDPTIIQTGSASDFSFCGCMHCLVSCPFSRDTHYC